MNNMNNIGDIDESDIVIIQCDICFDSFPVEFIESHTEECTKLQMELYKKHDITKIDNMVSIEPQLSNIQQIAIDYFQKKSKIFSNNIYQNLLGKFIKRGLDETVLEKVINYVKNDVKIVIHVGLDRVLDFFCDDDHYRNQFETNTSRGSLSAKSRDIWESNLFNKIYLNSSPFEKVKYGALNILNNNRGVLSAHGYGDSYFILKSHVKTRTSFVFGDSSSQQLHIQTFDHCNNILYYMSDSLLDEVISIALGTTHSSDTHYMYIEAQIHGPVRLGNDIEVLVVNPRHRRNRDILNNLTLFSDKHNCPWIFSDDL